MVVKPSRTSERTSSGSRSSGSPYPAEFGTVISSVSPADRRGGRTCVAPRPPAGRRPLGRPAPPAGLSGVANHRCVHPVVAPEDAPRCVGVVPLALAGDARRAEEGGHPHPATPPRVTL